MTAILVIMTTQGIDTSDANYYYKADLSQSHNWGYLISTGSFDGDSFGPQPVVSCAAVFGFPYLSQGQMLRPIEGGQNGPAFAKIRRAARMGLMVSYAHVVSIGSDFGDTLHSLPLSVNGNKDVSEPAANQLVSGIFRDSVDADYDYDGMLTWQFTDPYPGAILAAGGFAEVVDV